jgi:hypothetical protein
MPVNGRIATLLSWVRPSRASDPSLLATLSSVLTTDPSFPFNCPSPGEPPFSFPRLTLARLVRTRLVTLDRPFGVVKCLEGGAAAGRVGRVGQIKGRKSKSARARDETCVNEGKSEESHASFSP